MMNLRPEWSVFQRHSFKRHSNPHKKKMFQNRRSGILRSNTLRFDFKSQNVSPKKASRSYLRIPQMQHMRTREQRKQDPVIDERGITKVVSILRDINKNRKAKDSVKTDSTNSDSESDEEDSKYNNFTKFLEENIKKPTRKIKFRTNTQRTVAEMSNHKIPTFTPIIKKTQCLERLTTDPVRVTQIASPRLDQKAALNKAKSCKNIGESSRYSFPTMQRNDNGFASSQKSLQNMIDNIRSRAKITRSINLVKQVNRQNPTLQICTSTIRKLSGSHKSSETASSLLPKTQPKSPSILKKTPKKIYGKSHQKRKNLMFFSPQRRVQKKQRTCFDLGDLTYMKHLKAKVQA